jgi:hypothetical protein
LVPLLPRYYEALRFPAAFPTALRCPSLGGSTLVRLSLLRAADAHRPEARVVLRVPQPVLVEVAGPPRFLGTSSWSRALVSDPGGTSALGLLPRFGAAFRSAYGVSSHHSPFGAQSHGPIPRCLRFAVWVTPGPRKTRFRLAASFAGQGLNLQGSFVRFLRASISSNPPHPGFAWRTRSSAKPGKLNPFRGSKERQRLQLA